MAAGQGLESPKSGLLIYNGARVVFRLEAGVDGCLKLAFVKRIYMSLRFGFTPLLDTGSKAVYIKYPMIFLLAQRAEYFFGVRLNQLIRCADDCRVMGYNLLAPKNFPIGIAFNRDGADNGIRSR